MPNWDTTLMENVLILSMSIWKDRNTHIHGSNNLESKQCLQERVLTQVQQIYSRPPKLHRPLSAIKKYHFLNVWR